MDATHLDATRFHKKGPGSFKRNRDHFILGADAGYNHCYELYALEYTQKELRWIGKLSFHLLRV